MRFDGHLTIEQEKRVRAALPGARLVKGERRGRLAWWPITEVQMTASQAQRTLRTLFGPTMQVRPYAQAGVDGLIAKTLDGVHAVVTDKDYARLVWMALPAALRAWIGGDA